MTQRLSPSQIDLDAFKTVVESPSPKPKLAAEMHQGIPLYAAADLAAHLGDARRAALLDEWADVLLNGAGVFAIKGAAKDRDSIDHASRLFERIIAQERESSAGNGDHFAAAGNNDRIWNSLEKHALTDPQNFATYYANSWIDAAAEAWLGPRYQMTAQVNLVRPGGKAQRAHRDYHLGFMSQAQAAQWPAHAQALSASLTLQGALAHVDMPLASGPTKLLPQSQKYALGYLAFHDPAFRDYFETRCVQLSLSQGDLLWLNPATFHAAGENRTADVARLVNLFQVSSAFGRPMEAVNRAAILAKVAPLLDQFEGLERQALVRTAAEGYAFPTDLDRNPPVDGLAPLSDQDRLL